MSLYRLQIVFAIAKTAEGCVVPKQNTNNRMVWLVVGVLAGLCISYFWPHEPVSAATSDRDTNFGLITVPVRDVTIAGVRDTMEGVFVIDYLTGRLQGAVINPRIGKLCINFWIWLIFRKWQKQLWLPDSQKNG